MRAERVVVPIVVVVVLVVSKEAGCVPSTSQTISCSSDASDSVYYLYCFQSP